MTHIVDTLIEERAERWLRHPRLWRHMLRWLKPLLLYDVARQMMDVVAPMPGLQVLDHMQRTLAMDVRTAGLENVPRQGLVVATPNHPAGIADGIAVSPRCARCARTSRSSPTATPSASAPGSPTSSCRWSGGRTNAPAPRRGRPCAASATPSTASA